MIRFFLLRPIGALMATGFLVLLGVIGYAELKLALFPDLEVPTVFLATRFPGMSAAQVEQMVTVPIEEAISSTNNLKSLTSRSERGISVIEAVFEWKTDRNISLVELRQKLDQTYTSLPEDASRTLLLPYDPTKQPLMLLSIKDKRLGQRTRYFAETVLRSELEQIDGIAAIEIDGGYERQINVIVNRDRIQGYGLTPQLIADSIQSFNIREPVGQVRSGNYEKTIRINSAADSINDLSNIPVLRGENSGLVLLSQVSVIQDGYKDKFGDTLVNGSPAIVLKVRKEPGANSVITSKNVREALLLINKKYNNFIELQILEDKSQYIIDSIDSVRNAAILGATIAFALLYFFMKDFRSAVIVVLTIPIAITISFGFLNLFNVSLNIMSLSGLALGVGMLIDGSIIIVESISKNNITEDKTRHTLINSYQKGVNHVIGSLVASTLTTVIVFFPIVFVSGIAAALFRELAIAVIITMLAGLFCSIILIPTLLLLFHKKSLVEITQNQNSYVKTQFQIIHRTSDNLIIRSQEIYSRVMNAVLVSSRRIPIIICIISLLGVFLLLILPKSVMPEVDTGSIKVRINLPSGTPYEKTSSLVSELQAQFDNQSISRLSIANIGHETDDIVEQVVNRKPQSKAEMIVYLDAIEDPMQIIQSLRKGTEIQANPNPGPIQQIIGEGQNEYEVIFKNLQDRTSNEILLKLSDELKKKERVIAVDDYTIYREPVINVSVDRELLGRSNLSPLMVSSTLRAGIAGSIASVFRDGDRSIDIRVRFAPEYRRDIQDLEAMQLVNGEAVHTLKGLIVSNHSFDDPPLMRLNQKRIHSLRFKLIDDSIDEIIPQIDRFLQEQLKRAGSNTSYTIEPVNRKTVESLNQLFFAFGLSCVFIFQLLAGQFESFKHAASLLFSIPGLLLGAGIALLITGSGLNISSGIGMVMLTGIVINASIALYEGIQLRMPEKDSIDYNHKLRKAIISAGNDRIRPILLTSLTSIGGVLPLAIGIGTGSENQQPMGIAMVGGMLIGTLIALVVFPGLFYLVESKPEQ